MNAYDWVRFRMQRLTRTEIDQLCQAAGLLSDERPWPLHHVEMDYETVFFFEQALMKHLFTSSVTPKIINVRPQPSAWKPPSAEGNQVIDVEFTSEELSLVHRSRATTVCLNCLKSVMDCTCEDLIEKSGD